MDYTKVPRALIYKDRNDLKGFGVQTPDTMNNILFKILKQQALMGVSGAREVALRCFNNAYYVCTLILLEAKDFPELRISDYVDKILEIEKDKGHVDEVCLVSMAMTCQLLEKYDKKRYGRDSDVWNAINYRCTHYQWYHSSATAIFHNMISCEYRITIPLSNTEFAPRDIIEVIENCSERDLQVYAEYICERLALLKDPSQRMHGADMAIARIKDYQRELCEASEYDPEKDCFKYANNDYSLRDLTSESEIRDYYQQSKEAIDYYTEHYPTTEGNDSKEKDGESPQAPETEFLQTEIRELKLKLTQLENQLKETNVINTQYATRIEEQDTEIKNLQNELKEAHTIPDTVTAQQKVRMELTRKLIEAAGINEEILAKWGNKDKAGTLIGMMLDILPSTCKTYISDPYLNSQYHKETIEKINSLLDALGIKFRL